MSKGRREYDLKKLDQAVFDVQNKIESYRSAEKKYGIPKSTIEFRIKHPENKTSFGPSPVLTNEEETLLVNWVKETAQKGFPRKANDLQTSVHRFLNDHPRPNPFKNNRPGMGWVKAFLKRHPDISERTSESVTSASACIAEKDIRHWFSEIEDYIRARGLEEVIADPTRVFNGDESGFQICPSTGKVFAQRGSKNVYSVDRGSSKENITVMFTFSANGDICVPMVIYPYQRIPEKISMSVDPNWGIGRSDNGWMTSETFYQYISNVFYPHLIEKNVEFPVILFLDGHKSNLTYSLSVLCSELQIEVFALYPNATRILQPCDVAVFRPLKEAWRRTVRDWEEEHPGQILNKITFAPLLKKAIQISIKPETLVNGFKACGLFPFNVDAIDYSKCLGGESSKSKKDSNSPQELLEKVKMSYDTFVNIVGQETISEFMSNKIASDEKKTLFKLWKYFNQDSSSGKTNNMIEVEPPKINILQNIVVRSPKTPEKTINISPSVPVETEKITVEVMVHHTKTPVKNEESQTNDHEPSQKILSRVKTIEESQKQQPEAIVKSNTICDKVVVSSNLFGSFLSSPEAPQRKGKRNIERFPFAITSRKYQEMFEQKREKREKEEKAKEDRKRKREEEALKNKKNTQKENLEKKRKLIKNNPSCFVCHKTVTINSKQLECDSCKKIVHQLCVPKSHSVHIPTEEDQDEIFLCHLCYKEDNGSDSSENFSEKFEYDSEVDELFSLYKDACKEH